MSTAPVERLQQLLSRVQENRQQPRAAAAVAAQPRAAQPRAPERPSVAQPARATASRGPLHPDPRREPSPDPRREPEVEVTRPSRDRVPTPLEMAVEDELRRPSAHDLEPPTTKAARPAPAPGPALPLTFEPEPLKEGGRAVAQVVSKHAPEPDATFGAMLRRSLSLRPR